MASPSQVPVSQPAGVVPTSAAPAAVEPHAQTRWPWLKYATPLFILLLAGAVAYTLAHNWNGWEGGRVEQVTDDAFVRGDLTPLSTKVAGIVRNVIVNDYQKVHAGDLLVELQDDDYQAQIAQAQAAVQAAHAAIQNNHKQRELQDARIDRALAGIDQAKSQIAAAQAGKEAVQADVTRTRAERTRQESLLTNHAATQQHVEAAVADEQRFAAQAASREADFQQAKTALRANEIAVETERRTKAVLESQEQMLLADLHAKEAALSAAQVNLGYTKIHAPADGVVGERQVRTGQLVSPGTQVVTFVAENKWVQANYRETQLTYMKAGDPVEIKIDTFPYQVFRGKVLEIAPASGSQFALLPPDNASGNFTKVVQRIPVKISFDDTTQAARLRPGLSVTATVKTRQ